ncbi:MAG: type VI secretion system protein TssA [Pseudomonadota bacterium]|nr:type VI secretion system protein TssA [Pseudomonadota bacterium]
MAELELEPLLSALAEDAPCGPDLGYDPAFQAMLEAGAGKPERQYGDKVYPAEPPDWPAVHEQALQLARRTRDLRVAVWLMRSGARLRGLAGAVTGLQLVSGLLDRQWEHVHPALDSSDNNDPTARVNALMALADPTAGLSDLRAASLSGKRGSLTVREIELALGSVDVLPGESMPSEAGVLQGVSQSLAAEPGLASQMQAGYEAAQALATCLDRHLEASQSPDLTPLKKVLQHVADAGRKAAGGGEEIAADSATATAARAAPGTINSRDDAQRALERVCEWIDRNEPTNPAPLLIRRAQRLMSKSFIDIIRDLAPDGLKEIEKLAGTANS